MTVQIKRILGTAGAMENNNNSNNKNSVIPPSASSYRSKEYWDWRYKQEGSSPLHYDWILGYTGGLREHLQPLLRPSDRILVIGCGNSSLSEDLYADGYQNILSTDYSETIIEAMSKRSPHLQWSVMDMREMVVVAEGSFDAVLDKSALDALWSDGGSQWDPSPSVREDVGRAVNEVYRVLRPGGIFVVISFGQPHFRRPLLMMSGRWSSFKAIPLKEFYHMYVMQK